MAALKIANTYGLSKKNIGKKERVVFFISMVIDGGGRSYATYVGTRNNLVLTLDENSPIYLRKRIVKYLNLGYTDKIDVPQELIDRVSIFMRLSL